MKNKIIILLFLALIGITNGWSQIDEDFNTISGTGGNPADFNSTGTIVTSPPTDWTFTAIYAGNQCIKAGTGSAKGIAVTPALGIAGSATLTFRAAAWNGTSEATELMLTISGGGNLSAASVVLSKTAWTSYTINITNSTAATTISFAGKNQNNARFFLDDVLIVADCVLPAAPTGTIATVGSAPFCGSSISFTRNGGSAAPSGIVFYWQTTSTGTSTSFPLSSNPTYTITGTGARTACLRAFRTAGGCWSTNSISASGIVYALPVFSVQPLDKAVAPNTNLTFTTTSTNTVSRQWQVSTDNGDNWQNLANTLPYSGVTSATLTITGANASVHGNLYKMIATNNGCTTTSNSAKLSIVGTPAITAQTSIDYTSCNSAAIKVTAANVLGTTADLSYKWFAYVPGSNDWSALVDNSIYTGTQTNILLVSSFIGVTTGTQYYVQVYYKNQTCYTASKAVRLIFTAATTHWDGTWSDGTPSASTVVVLDADYNTATANLTACSLDLNGHTLTINTDQQATIHSAIIGTGNINIQDSGSLIQVTDGIANGTQWTMNMERITKKVFRYDFSYWGSPLTKESSFTLHDLSPFTLFDKFYAWNATTGAWTAYPHGNHDMIPGRGYIVRAPQNYAIEGTSGAVAQTYTANFTGHPNNGIITQAVVGDNSNNKWNLLSNPYPSALNIEDFLEDNKDYLEGTVYLWTHNTRVLSADGSEIYSYSPSDYASYNFSGPVGTRGTSAPSEDNPGGDADNNNNEPTQYLAAGQAFFVKGLANGEVTFSNLYRGGSNNNFFKPAPTTPIDNWEMTGKHRVWINLSGTDAFNQILVGYIENATNELDWGYDGMQFGGNKVTLYSIQDNTNLVIQGRALPFNNQDQIPLGYKTTLTGTLKISIDHLDGLLEGQDIFLEDLLLNSTHNLKESDYSFNAVPGTFNDRFVLKFMDTTLGNGEHEALPDGLLIYNNKGKISVKSEQETLKEITVYDLLGKIVYENKALSQKQFSISNVVMNEQVLVVKVKLENGVVVSRKIVY